MFIWMLMDVYGCLWMFMDVYRSTRMMIYICISIWALEGLAKATSQNSEIDHDQPSIRTGDFSPENA